MLTNIKPLKYRVGGVGAILRSYGFSDGKVILDSLHIVAEEKHLGNCFSICVNHSALLRTSCIDKKEKFNEFLESAKVVHQEMGTHKKTAKSPLRISSTLLCEPKDEWKLIATQHALFSSADSQALIHINIPTAHIYTPKLSRKHADQTGSPLTHVTKLQNVVAWTTYCQWLNSEMEQYLAEFHPDTVDEYQLEGALKNVTCEMNSLYLQRSAKRESLLAIEENQPDRGKKLATAREELQADLRTLYDAFEKVEIAISKIEHDHPEFIHLRSKTSLLRTLIGNEAEVPGQKAPSWGQQLMMIHLLNDHFNTLSAVNCNTGLDRTSIVFSIWLALAELRREYSINRITDMVLHWDETTNTLNKVIASDGVENNFSDKEQAQLKLRSTLVIQLREYVLANLQVFSLPITALSSGSTVFEKPNHFQVNTNFLNFLPSYGELQTEQSDIEMVKLVNYHPQSGKPLSLTDEGDRLMEPLAYLGKQ